LEVKEKIKSLLTDLKIDGLNVKFIRSDNAGENMTIKNDPEIKSFGFKLEFLVLELLKEIEWLKGILNT
jgi:hypothetical protein